MSGTEPKRGPVTGTVASTAAKPAGTACGKGATPSGQTAAHQPAISGVRATSAAIDATDSPKPRSTATHGIHTRSAAPPALSAASESGRRPPMSAQANGTSIARERIVAAAPPVANA
jgi:hypothetical protein